MTDITPDVDFLQESMEFEVWVLNMGASLMFNGNSLTEWNNILSIPTVSSGSEMSIVDIERMNNKALNIIETVMSNLAIAKSAYYAAKSNHEINILKTRRDILQEHELANARKPSNENLEGFASLRCLKTYKLFAMSELIHEFWTVQNYKLNRFNERLTSINIARQR